MWKNCRGSSLKHTWRQALSLKSSMQQRSSTCNSKSSTYKKSLPATGTQLFMFFFFFCFGRVLMPHSVQNLILHSDPTVDLAVYDLIASCLPKQSLLEMPQQPSIIAGSDLMANTGGSMQERCFSLFPRAGLQPAAWQKPRMLSWSACWPAMPSCGRTLLPCSICEWYGTHPHPLPLMHCLSPHSTSPHNTGSVMLDRSHLHQCTSISVLLSIQSQCTSVLDALGTYTSGLVLLV